MNRSHWPRMALVLIMATLAPAAAQQLHGAADTVFVFTGEALDGPQQVDAGFRLLALQNDSETFVDFDLVRLHAGVAAEEASRAIQQAEAAAMADGDFVAALEATLAVGELWGGALAPPGTRPSVGLDLVSGSYLVVGRYHHLPEAGADGVGYLVRTLEVIGVAPTGQEPPPVDVSVDMVDFAYGIPHRLPAGRQVWHVVNRGRQVHHVSLLRLDADASYDDVMRFLITEEGEPPGEFVASTNILSPGVGNYLILDLEAGAYVLACFLPDHRNGTGEPHFLLGMISVVTLGEE